MAHFTYPARAEFAHTDMAGIVHFTEFFKYAEAAEAAMWRSLGFSLLEMVDGELIGWPRVTASFDFLQPLHFEENFAGQLTVSDIGDSSVTYHIVLDREGETIARGKTVVVCIAQGMEGEYKKPIPEIMRSALNDLLQRQ